MITFEKFKCVTSGFCYGISSASFLAGLACNAGLVSSAGIAQGTNLLVNAIVFYGIPGFLDRLTDDVSQSKACCKVTVTDNAFEALDVAPPAPTKKMKKTSKRSTVRMKKSSR